MAGVDAKMSAHVSADIENAVGVFDTPKEQPTNPESVGTSTAAGSYTDGEEETDHGDEEDDCFDDEAESSSLMSLQKKKFVRTVSFKDDACGNRHPHTTTAGRPSRFGMLGRTATMLRLFGQSSETALDEPHHGDILEAFTNLSGSRRRSSNKIAVPRSKDSRRRFLGSGCSTPSSILEGVDSTNDVESGHDSVWPLTVTLMMLLVGAFILPAIVLGKKSEINILVDLTINKGQLLNFISPSISLIPICYFIIRAARSFAADEPTTKESGSARKNRSWSLIPNRSSSLLLTCLVLQQVKFIARELVAEEYQVQLIFLINRGLAFTIFELWMGLLHDCMVWFHSFADRLEAISSNNPKGDKWRGVMKKMSRFNVPEVDKAYAIPGGSRSPARVLAEILAVYCNLGRILGFLFLFLYMLDIDLYSSVVIFGSTASFLAVVQTLHLNEACGNLIPLAISNAIHLGEIVSVSRTGEAPADYPDCSLCGFVEAITWSHLVIRDFRRKQVFVPHEELQTMTIHNWSRRPSKMIRVQLRVVAPVGGGTDKLAALSQFCRSWINQHPKIDHNLYKKSCLKMNQHGNRGQSQPMLQAQFYPKIGVQAREIRAEFIVMLMEASRRLNICLVPTEMQMSKAWIDDTESSMEKALGDYIASLGDKDDRYGDDGDGEDPLLSAFQDLMPSERLSRRAGLKGKLD